MKIRFVPSWFAVVAIWLAGCGTVPESAMLENTPAADAPLVHEHFVALNQAAQAAIECVAIFTRTLPAGRLEVVANLRNTSDQPLRLKANCVFKDAQRRVLRDETPAHMVEVSAGALETVRFTAPASAARHFTVRVGATR